MERKPFGLCPPISMYTFASSRPSRSDSVNFWFYARSGSRPAPAVTETSFPAVHAPSLRASPAGTFAGIEHSEETDEDAATDFDSTHQWSPSESLHQILKRPASV